MTKPRSSAATARTGSYPSVHAGLLLHVRHQVQHGQPQFGVHLAPHVGDVAGPAYSTACGLAALVIAGSHYVLTLEAAAQLAADFALPVRTAPEFDGA
ncbi:hypothetical protein [Xanthomonas axonopodis]|uniref:hypothetical protein n=1 Tax=Xanthomonas axonopodis TaxID=53413 RepID=UPI000997421C|nr:hypothetical protein [Xanthomonas axonopodis]OOX17233.1 hypothetical protein Xbuh_11955 [Xanthomonas axonopodis pv. bauhiniae]